MPNIFDKIFGSAVKETLSEVGNVVNGLVTTDKEKSTAKAQLSKIVLNALNQVTEAQKQVLVMELQGNFLQRSWRPLLMLIFSFIIIAKWFGFTDSNITDQLELELLNIIKIGLGGYVFGRTAEKISEQVTKNIDMPFLKKKDRA